jgi:hypothetical protein
MLTKGQDTHLPKEAPGAESPTTARPLDFDDEPPNAGLTPPHPAAEEPAPPKPPRPLSPQRQAEATLREAFPSIDAAVVRAVLTASGGHIEPAFNALLGTQILSEGSLYSKFRSLNVSRHD